MQRSARFYADHFGYVTSYAVVDGLIELKPQDGGAEILIHQAAKSLKLGSAALKLSFSVPDVDRFVGWMGLGDAIPAILRTELAKVPEMRALSAQTGLRPSRINRPARRRCSGPVSGFCRKRP